MPQFEEIKSEAMSCIDIGWTVVVETIPIELIDPVSPHCRRAHGVPWIMDETYLQRPGSGPADCSIAAAVLLRGEPDEEEEDEEDEEEHDGDEEDDDGDEGYSEWTCSGCCKISRWFIFRPVLKASDVNWIERRRNPSAMACVRQLTAAPLP
jgi:hypothetical protein